MTSARSDNREAYRVVINHEEQYSIWPVHKELPAGWNAVGPIGDKDACLKWIGSTWTDMRPLSVRQDTAS
ncbi:MbtH family NRPS accessory protein [Chromobacterium amazonense]|uniref:MbtH family protein n=1 Tax=Chromobacterium amazonense TaxID=1382803 RepID=UPI00237D89FA|nr:MbtH family NRPS accessory protein [Chromobacterium amazonense]MDE1715946.1 MbtH family NRPS accessory protein [Chromobacterium amazonense]